MTCDPAINCESCGNLSASVAPHGARDDSLAGFFRNILDTSNYPPRWQCGEWTSFEGWLHILSDVGIFLAYFAIPLALVYFARRRRDIPFNGIVLLFAAFILCCGTGHLLEAVIFYYPLYRVAGLWKLTTAVVSWVTVLALLRNSQKLLEIPGLATRNEALRQADLAKSAFLANMSHEIRTPMAAILGYTEVLLDQTSRQTPPEHLQAVQAIQRNGKHLLRVINDVLDLSKIEAGGSLIELGQCSPYTAAAEVVALLREQASAKGVGLTLEAVGELPATIVADETRVRQILFNIIGNALKFTDAGEVRVTLRHETSPADTSRIRIDVADTGIGIAPEAIGELFNPFTQVDASFRRRHSGTGLGLTISRRLARAMGGDIVVTSTLGQGSVFTITIATGPPADAPLVTASATTGGSTPVAAPLESAAAETYDGRVLLAEDGADNQRLIRYLLNKAGIQVEIVQNGEEALAAVREAEARGSAYDVILMDMHMPVLDGYEATRRLRLQGCEARIIAVTANAMSGDREKCLEAGCDAYLTKPIDRHALVSAVRSALAVHGPVGAA